MKTRSVVVATALGALVLASSLTADPAFTAPTPQAPGFGISLPQEVESRAGEGPRFVPDEVVVRFAKDASAEVRSALQERIGARRVRSLGVPRLFLLRLEPGASVPSAVEALEQSAAVLYAEPNFIIRSTAVVPNDAGFPQQWGLANGGQVVEGVAGIADADIDATEAWSTTTGSPDAVIAVIDSGVALDHPDLVPNLWRNPGETGGGRESNGIDDDGDGYIDDFRGWDFAEADNDPTDHFGHGTHAAGVVAARGNNGFGVAGVAWQAKIMPLRILDDFGNGSTANAAAAFSYAGGLRAHAANLSFTGAEDSQAVADAIAGAPNTLFVVASGNDAANIDVTPSYPCNHPMPNIVCVAASTQSDELAYFSNYGASSVDLAAPGMSILSAHPLFLTPLREDFETDFAGRWSTGGTNNTWGRVTDAAGGYVTDSPSGNYVNGTNSFIESLLAANLSGGNHCRLHYNVRLESEPGRDGVVVEASTDRTTWTEVARYAGSTGGQWIFKGENLSSFDGRPAVYVRFRMLSDNNGVNLDGVAIDNVTFSCLSAGYNGTEYAYISGTSFAAPHVAGVAALLWSVAPGASVAAVKNALLAGADRLSAFTATTASGGRLNAQGALQALSPASNPTPISSPTPVVSPTSGFSPLPSPSASPVGATHERSVSFRLKRRGKGAGRVRVLDDFAPCAAGVRVRILRNGRRVARATTTETGSFTVKSLRRRGRYVAAVKQIAIDERVCEAASSRPQRRR